jgi:hypothetical protein
MRFVMFQYEPKAALRALKNMPGMGFDARR